MTNAERIESYGGSVCHSMHAALYEFSIEGKYKGCKHTDCCVELGCPLVQYAILTGEINDYQSQWRDCVRHWLDFDPDSELGKKAIELASIEIRKMKEVNDDTVHFNNAR